MAKRGRKPKHFKKKPSGVTPDDNSGVKNARDPQLDRATDLLKGIMLYTDRAPIQDQRLAKDSKMVEK